MRDKINSLRAEIGNRRAQAVARRTQLWGELKRIENVISELNGAESILNILICPPQEVKESENGHDQSKIQE